jgi:hypothetical protein
MAVEELRKWAFAQIVEYRYVEQLPQQEMECFAVLLSHWITQPALRSAQRSETVARTRAWQLTLEPTSGGENLGLARRGETLWRDRAMSRTLGATCAVSRAGGRSGSGRSQKDRGSNSSSGSSCHTLTVAWTTYSRRFDSFQTHSSSSLSYVVLNVLFLEYFRSQSRILEISLPGR